MIEVSGVIRDGIVDPEKAQNIAVKLGADAIVMGTILDLKESSTQYQGYTMLKETIYAARLRVRIINLTKEKGSDRIVPVIPFSKVVSGRVVVSETPYLKLQSGDFFFTAISEALQTLADDERFKTGMADAQLGSARLPMTQVVFAPTPPNCSIYLSNEHGWKYLGESPLTNPLPTGIPQQIRLEKPGFAPWQTLIEPGDALRVTRELERQNLPAFKP